jgi:transposase
MWCIPKLDKQYIERMLDVLELYERPYDQAHPVVCFDEKSHQLLSTPRGSRPMRPALHVCHEDYEYKRHGTVNLFVAIEPKGGKRVIEITDKRKKPDTAKFIEQLVMEAYKDAEQVILITDNLNTHTEKAILETLGKERGNQVLNRIDWHYTPKHASWLDAAEIEIGRVTKAVLRKRTPDKEQLKKEVAAYAATMNEQKKGITWQFTRMKAKEKFRLQD